MYNCVKKLLKLRSLSLSIASFLVILIEQVVSLATDPQPLAV